MAELHTPETITDFPLSIVKSMISLSSSGFGVVVALAWNELIQKVVKDYLDPYFGKNGGVISMFVYAVIVTILAVVVTMQLVSLQRKIEVLNEKVKLKALRKKQLQTEKARSSR